MEYRKLGDTGLRVSEVCLGSWLTYGNSVGANVAEKCVEAAFDEGINFFDTANVYAQGEAEKTLGKVLESRKRSDYVLATKVYFSMGESVNDRGLSRKHVFEQMDASLDRLGVDYVDLYQCHRYDDQTPLEETLTALDDLVGQGKALYLGFSEWPAEKISEARELQEELGLTKFVSSQPQYSLLWREPEKQVFPICEKQGISQIVWSPLGQGVLTGKYPPGKPIPQDSRAANPKSNVSQFISRLITDENRERVEKMRPIAEREGLTLAQLSLSWCLRKNELASVIIGATKPEQVKENCGVKKLSDETLKELGVLFP
ncbi:voltage-gated potassium channel [Candidatus Micrarchaeota archaeon CG1_02_55_22]|nr:MAG: voltage-gated potassium channel [Candidatus Micrarchaeota archaeon CG1_02_55_22]